MLKSTHRPEVGSPALPPSWTEYKAPTGMSCSKHLYHQGLPSGKVKADIMWVGHAYYYNATTKESTYTRPTLPKYGGIEQPYGFNGSLFPNESPTGSDHVNGTVVGLRSHASSPQPFQAIYETRGRSEYRGGHSYQDRRRVQIEDRPRSKHEIPGCSPWLLVKTKLGRRFVFNPEKEESFWKFPPEVMKSVIEYDRLEREERQKKERGEEIQSEDEAAIAAKEPKAAEVGPSIGPASVAAHPNSTEVPEDSDEYEEVEVTDDENEDDAENPFKRQKTENGDEDQPVEFNEDDIAYQLAAMGQDYGLDPGEYGDGEGQDLEEGAEGLPLTVEDSHALFKDMLDDHHISPYTTWEKLIEEGRIIDDDRYVVLPNMKSRKEVWGEWSRDRIQRRKEQREREAKNDPRIPYMAFLQQYATPKLYWPEFRRKYKKEPEMKDTKLFDKDREKWYRDHINRLKLPESTLKADLRILLDSIPLRFLNRSSSLGTLPVAILTDVRYISLKQSVRDELIEYYISGLPAAPENTEISIEEEQALTRQKQERDRREKALAERERQVQEEKRKQMGALQYSKGMLKEGEREIQRAMRVGKEGLFGYQERADQEEVMQHNGSP